MLSERVSTWNVLADQQEVARMVSAATCQGTEGIPHALSGDTHLFACREIKASDKAALVKSFENAGFRVFTGYLSDESDEKAVLITNIVNLKNNDVPFSTEEVPAAA